METRTPAFLSGVQEREFFTRERQQRGWQVDVIPLLRRQSLARLLNPPTESETRDALPNVLPLGGPARAPSPQRSLLLHRSCASTPRAFLRLRHSPLPRSRPRCLFPRPTQRPIHSLLLLSIRSHPPGARKRPLHRRGRNLHSLHTSHRNFPPPFHGL